MSSKKLASLSALFVILMPLLAACGAENPTATPAAAPEATATTGSAAAAPTNTTEAAAAADTPTTATTSGGTTSGGNVFRWRAFAEPETFDPALMQETLSIDIGQNIHEGLTEFDQKTLE